MGDLQQTARTQSFGQISTTEFRKQFATSCCRPGFHEGSGDHVLNHDIDSGAIKQQESYRDAAVFFGVIERPGGATVLLTRRTETLSSHKGQVALPGGRIDDDDQSPESAALRETSEEVGIGAENIEVLGRLGDYYSGSGYRVKPVIGIIDPGFSLVINADEVAEVFEVPLGFLMDAGNHEIGSAVWNDRERYFYKMPFGKGRNLKPIWGLTAGIIRLVHDRIYG